MRLDEPRDDGTAPDRTAPRRRSGPAAPGVVAACAGLLLVSAGAVAGAAGAAPPAAAEQAAGSVEVARETLAMGTRLRIRAEAADRPAGIRAIGAAFDAVERIENTLSTWRAGTGLSRLNRTPVDRPARPASGLLGLLAEARRWSEATGGAFEPAVGALVDAWDLRGEGRIPADDELEAVLRATGPDAVEIDPDAGTVTRRDGRAWIDAGGFGKGAALRVARRALEREGAKRALVDFGGQVLAAGGGWTIAVAHPDRRAEEAGVRLVLEDVSAATTSASERRVVVGGDTLGHVLDPRTGRPAPAWGSVTVVAEDPLAADALSTALFVMGADEAMRWARGRPDHGVLVLERGEDGSVRTRANDAMERWLETPPQSPPGSTDRHQRITRYRKGTDR